MAVRIEQTTLDCNSGTDSDNAKIKDKQERWKLAFSKVRQDWTTKQIK